MTCYWEERNLMAAIDRDDILMAIMEAVDNIKKKYVDTDLHIRYDDDYETGMSRLIIVVQEEECK